MQFLDLPTEVIQLVLFYCTAPSFFQFIRTCQQIFKTAGSSRDVLLHHLEKVPGIILGLQDQSVSNQSLFLTLRRRGIAHLVGANFQGDFTHFYPKYGTIDPNASNLCDGIVAVALKESLKVRIYSIEDRSCKLKSLIGSTPMEGIGKIMKVVQKQGSISILISYIRDTPGDENQMKERYPSCLKPVDEDSDDEGNAMVDSEFSIFDLRDTCYSVIHSSPFYPDDEIIYKLPAARPTLGRMLVPVDFAMSSKLNCAVLWDLPGSITPSIFCQVIVYTNNAPCYGESFAYSARRVWPLGDPDLSSSRNAAQERLKLARNALQATKDPFKWHLPRSICFAQHDRCLKIFTSGDTLPFNILKTTRASSRSRHSDDEEEEANIDQFDIPRNPWKRHLHSLLWTHTNPFYSQHVSRLVSHSEDDMNDDENNNNNRSDTQQCVISYLSLATTSMKRRYMTKKPPNPTYEFIDSDILCIMRSIETLDSTDCTHVPNLSSCVGSDMLNVRVVARLWGWQPSEASPTGADVVACCDTRVAIADWDRILVWSLDPRALIDEADDHIIHSTSSRPSSPLHSLSSSSPSPLPSLGGSDVNSSIVDNIMPNVPIGSSNPASSENGNDDNDHSDIATGPHLLMDPDLERPYGGQIRRDRTWTYPKTYDIIMTKWYVELKPIILKIPHISNGDGGEGGKEPRRKEREEKQRVVVRQLMWTNPDTLVVRSDHGVHMWNLGASASGKRESKEMEMDIVDGDDYSDYHDNEVRSEAQSRSASESGEDFRGDNDDHGNDPMEEEED